MIGWEVPAFVSCMEVAITSGDLFGGTPRSHLEDSGSAGPRMAQKLDSLPCQVAAFVAALLQKTPLCVICLGREMLLLCDVP
jgi:hypothetical protein